MKNLLNYINLLGLEFNLKTSSIVVTDNVYNYFYKKFGGSDPDFDKHVHYMTNIEYFEFAYSEEGMEWKYRWDESKQEYIDLDVYNKKYLNR